MIRLLLVDDDPFIRESLKLLLELDPAITVVGTCMNGDEAIQFIQTDVVVDMILMDIRMPVCDGVECTKRIKELNKEITILILTTFDDDRYVIEALKNGANGYILKNVPHHRIIENIKSVSRGDLLVHPQVARKITVLLQEKPDLEKAFTAFGIQEMELQIITRVANGLSNREIAHELFMSEGTVKNQISSILQKLSLRDRTQLAIYYLKHS